MNVFIQGMRRSGTTILFDILWEDDSFDCYYEPLAADKKSATGGGSGIRASIDYLARTRHCRTEFLTQYPVVENVDFLNYGAPRRPELEFETDLPDYCREYIKFILSQSKHTVIKFTRMYCKVRVLWETDPDAKFIHIVRDPRSVTTSYLFGKSQTNRQNFSNTRRFFRQKSKYTAWSSYSFSEFLLHKLEYAYLQDCSDFMRILLLWKYTFRKTYEMGRTLFKENYFIFRHEDLQKDPVQTLTLLYDFLERPLPKQVVDWAIKHVRNIYAPFVPDSKHWRKAFRKLDMEKDFELAGYADCLNLWRSPGLSEKLCCVVRFGKQSG